MCYNNYCVLCRLVINTNNVNSPNKNMRVFHINGRTTSRRNRENEQYSVKVFYDAGYSRIFVQHKNDTNFHFNGEILNRTTEV